MKKQIPILIGVATVLICVLGYFFLDAMGKLGRQSADEAEIANPASVNCINEGGILEMRESGGGTYGVCVFGDGSECEEWAFFRGECPAVDDIAEPLATTTAE